MKNNLFMDFSVDKENNKIIVKREFAATVSMVWDAYTKSEILDQWWAPKPWKTVTKSMDFREGGKWLYAMVGPEGDSHNCMAEYLSIKEHDNYHATDAFCDENWNINKDFPQAKWHVSFSQHGENTMVHIQTQYKKLSDLEMVINMGMKEGLTAAMENLDEIFKNA